MKAIYFSSIILLLLMSCEKVVDLNLKGAESKIVIDGDISNLTGPYFVKISKTVNYDQPNHFPAVSGAVVTISDDAGNTDHLQETSPGTYETQQIAGVPGRSYFLTVKVDGNVFEASSTMPQQVDIDNLSISEENIFGEIEKNIEVSFNDPAGTKNYYRFVVSNNGIPFKAYVSDDKLYDGQPVSISVEPDENDESAMIDKGDSIHVEMHAVDKTVYKYFLSLESYLDNGPPMSPANPLTNISNGGLGYFSAHAISEKDLKVD